MSARIFVAVMSMLCVSVCGLLATFANLEMLDQVNSKLPESEQFSMLGWYFSKYQRLHRYYKLYYPEGRLHLRVRILTGVMFACLVIAAWSLGLFTK
jgi:hypothetical protein